MEPRRTFIARSANNGAKQNAKQKKLTSPALAAGLFARSRRVIRKGVFQIANFLFSANHELCSEHHCELGFSGREPNHIFFTKM